jgi:uncharacterized protein (TIGR03067 family)
VLIGTLGIRLIMWLGPTIPLPPGPGLLAALTEVTVTNDADGGWGVRVEGKVAARGTSRIDPAKRPKAIDLTPTEGEHKGQTARGIYEVEGDTLKICFAEPDKPRPTEFTGKTEATLAVFKRGKS